MSDSNSSNCDNTIVSAAIYPPIGIMRVGNSASEYFIGPEVDQPIPRDSSYYRDETGALKRQAARFRVYGLNANGDVVAELTNENANVEWTVRLANQKASWYEFQLALDIPEAAEAPPSLLRNKKVTDRSKLLINGGEHSVSGVCVGAGNAPKFSGKFHSQNKDGTEKVVDVYLGEMHTDDKGRLLMLGGHGKSANPQGDPAVTFGNNEGWYDDTSDGPVTATVEYEGAALEVKPAWVVAAPPDYAPMQKSVRTMWDLMHDMFVTADMLPEPGMPSFTRDILPVFQRMTDLQWVNAGFAAGFGWQSNNDFTQGNWLQIANSTDDKWQQWRRIFFNSFRRIESTGAWNPEPSSLSPQMWPWIYGDAMSTKATESPRQFVSITSLQIRYLEQWVNGDFIADYDSGATPITDVEQLPPNEQPEMLTRAAMDFCLADAFHPGCEMTWPMRTVGMYSEAFRLKPSDNTAPTHGINYGPVMTTQIVEQTDGPLLSGQVAGGITRWMAIPWQTDTASCRDGYNTDYDPYLPTFWPARVPNNILNQENYAKVVDERLPLPERQTAFNEREFWLNDLPIGPSTDYEAQINSMVDGFGELTVVLPRTQPGVPGFPTTMQVGETPFHDSAEKRALKQKAEKGCRPDLSTTDKANCLTKHK